MNRKSIIWLAAGLLSFGLGMAGGRGLKKSAAKNPEPIPRETSTLRSAVANPMGSGISIDPLEYPQIAERLATLERIANVGVDELPGLVRELMAARSNKYDIADLHCAIDRWIELDPAGGLDFFASEYPEKKDQFYVMRFAGQWALVDPTAAIASAKKLQPGAKSELCLAYIVQEFASKRPAEFFKFSDIGREEARSHLLSEAAQQLSKTDPQAVLEILPGLNESARHGITADIAFGWAEKDSRAAIEWARGLDVKEGRARALRAIAAKLIDIDPAHAATIYQEGRLPDESALGFPSFIRSDGYSGRNFGWREIAKKLALKNPLAALEWDRQFGADRSVGNAVISYLPASASGAIDYLAQLPADLFEDGNPGEKIRGHANWPEPSDVETGLAKLNDIADPKLRETAHAWLLEEQATTDPRTAIASAQDEISSANARSRILENALRSWAASDLNAASTWLSEQPQGSELDAGIKGILGAMRSAEPEAAIQWAGAISDPKSRLDHISIILNEQPIDWARKTFDQLELSPAEREQLDQQFSHREQQTLAPAR